MMVASALQMQPYLKIMSLQLLTIQHWLKKHATYRPNHPAIIFEDKRLSYKQLTKK